MTVSDASLSADLHWFNQCTSVMDLCMQTNKPTVWKQSLSEKYCGHTMHLFAASQTVTLRCFWRTFQNALHTSRVVIPFGRRTSILIGVEMWERCHRLRPKRPLILQMRYRWQCMHAQTDTHITNSPCGCFRVLVTVCCRGRCCAIVCLWSLGCQVETRMHGLAQPTAPPVQSEPWASQLWGNGTGAREAGLDCLYTE